MDSKYDQWNSTKKKIALSNHKPPYYKELDIWWISIGYNIGNEVYGKGKDFARPVLVLRKFNKYMFIGIPLSSKLKKNPYYLPIQVKNKSVSALISQIRTFSSRRMLYKLDELDIRNYSKVNRNMIGVLKLPPSITRGSRG